MFRWARTAGLIALLTMPIAELRATSVWTNAAGGLYSSPSNWSGGVPLANQAVTYNLDGTYTVNVDVAANHGATQFSANNGSVTFNITGPGYSIPSTVKIGTSSGTNNVSILGSSFDPTNVEIAPSSGGIGSLTLSGPMHSSIVALGGQISVSGSGAISEIRGGPGTLTLNPGANLTTNTLIANNAGTGSQIAFNGGTLTILGDGRFNGNGSPFTQVGDGTHAATLNLLNGSTPGNVTFNGRTLTVSNNATVNLNSPDGILSVGNLVRDSSGSAPGLFNWVAGNLRVTSAGFDVAPTGQLGGSLDLTPTRSLLVTTSTTVASGSSLTISGGRLFTNTFTVNPGGTANYSGGLISVDSGGLEIGPNGITHAGGVALTNPSKDFIEATNGELSIANGHSLTINGGGVFTKTISNNGLLAFTSGFINMEGPLSIGPAGQLNNSPNLTIGDGMSLYDYKGDVTIDPTQTVTLDGGGLTAAHLINNGTLIYNSGGILLGQGDITVGPTGQIRNQPYINIQGGLETDDATVTIQETQTADISGVGRIWAKNVVIDGTVNNVGAQIYGETISVGGANGTGQLTVTGWYGMNVNGTTLYRGNVLVNSGVINCSTIAPPPNYLHNSGMTINAGEVYANDLQIGAMPGFVDTVTVNGGTFQGVNLLANKGAASVLNFNGGTINTAHADVDGPSALVIGNGSTYARLNLYGGSQATYSFADGLVISTSGELNGDGTITGDVTNYGKLSPFYSGTGMLKINGSFVNSGVLALDIDSIGSIGNFTVNGTFNAGGVIAITSYGYPPLEIGATLDLIDFASFVDGGYTFDSSRAVLPNGSRWDFTQFATDGTIRVVATPAGDFNQDGRVDAADYVAWRKGVDLMYTMDHYNTWRSQFGLSAPPGIGADLNVAVPECSSIATLLTGMMLMLCRRVAVTPATPVDSFPAGRT